MNPAKDISRAINFYQEILEVHIENTISRNGNGSVSISRPDGYRSNYERRGYEPSASGITIYFNGGDNLQNILDKVEKNGGKIIIPKTHHADEIGFFAIFLDSEGNKIGLHSAN